MPADKMQASPNLVLRIAVTGHRPPIVDAGNAPAIRLAIRAILNRAVAIAAKLASNQGAAYSGAPPVLRILSSLAEGSDRLFAEEALALRRSHAILLECPLPAASAEYRKDFKTAESAFAFDGLLKQATTRFELDGQREGDWLRSSDYHRAGHIAVSNCDLLVAIWDRSPGSPGSTAEIAREAMQNQVPVLCIDPKNAESIEFCGRSGRWESD